MSIVQTKSKHYWTKYTLFNLLADFQNLYSTPRKYFQKSKISRQNQASWACCSQDPTIIEPIKTFFNLWDVFQIHSQPLGSTSKASIQPQKILPKVSQATWASCSQDPTIINQLILSSNFWMFSKSIINPLGVLPKPLFNPKKVLPNSNHHWSH